MQNQLSVAALGKWVEFIISRDMFTVVKSQAAVSTSATTLLSSMTSALSDFSVSAFRFLKSNLF